jgi:CRP-like cAMP-binding protein
MITDLIDHINSIEKIDDEMIVAIGKIANLHRFPKGTLLLAEGQISDKLFFISKGIARCFYYEKEEEVTSWIVAEKNFVYSVSSFIQRKPSFESIQLLEDSELVSISYKNLELFYKNYPKVIYLGLKVTEKYLLLYDERVRSLKLPAKERYMRFQKQFPEISSKVKLSYLASYLGLSRSSLNIIRAKK